MKTSLLHTLREAFRLAQQTNHHPGKNLDDLLAEHRQHTLNRRQFLHTTARTGMLLGVGGPAIAHGLLDAALGKNKKLPS